MGVSPCATTRVWGSIPPTLIGLLGVDRGLNKSLDYLYIPPSFILGERFQVGTYLDVLENIPGGSEGIAGITLVTIEIKLITSI